MSKLELPEGVDVITLYENIHPPIPEDLPNPMYTCADCDAFYGCHPITCRYCQCETFHQVTLSLTEK